MDGHIVYWYTLHVKKCDGRKTANRRQSIKKIPGMNTIMSLYEWQTDCLKAWARNGYRGIVNAITGSGKTVLALAAVKRLAEVSDRELRVKIVVPQTFLAAQWKDEVRRQLGANATDVGIYSGTRKDQGRKYTVYVINSARYSLARHVISDINDGFSVLLIADECHHYGSKENNRIFDFYKVIGESAPYYALGLSATPEIVDFKAISEPLGREIYYYDLGRALRDRIISRFLLFSIRLDFKGHERKEYDELSIDLTKCMATLKRKRPELAGMPSALFFSCLQRLAQQGGDIGQLAQTTLALTYKRRTLCHMAAERPICAVTIVKALPMRLKIILFCERIQAAEQLHRDLLGQYPGQAGLYHSKMTDQARQNVLQQFRQGALRLLVCCKALDEGLNIPSTDAGIIVSTSMSARQRVQRLGRMLRRSNEIKRIYYLYIGESSEDSELVLGLRAMENHIPLITLRFFGGKATHSEYEKLRGRVLGYVSGHRDDPKLLGALSANLDLVLLRGDFLMHEQACREKLQAAGSIAERQYWTSALYVILARLNKL